MSRVEESDLLSRIIVVVSKLVVSNLVVSTTVGIRVELSGVRMEVSGIGFEVSWDLMSMADESSFLLSSMRESKLGVVGEVEFKFVFSRIKETWVELSVPGLVKFEVLIG